MGTLKQLTKASKWFLSPSNTLCQTVLNRWSVEVSIVLLSHFVRREAIYYSCYLPKSTKWPTQLRWLSCSANMKRLIRSTNTCVNIINIRVGRGPAFPGFALRDAQPAEEAKGQVESFMKVREWISGSSFLKSSYVTPIFKRYLYPVLCNVCLNIKPRHRTMNVPHINVSHICGISSYPGWHYKWELTSKIPSNFHSWKAPVCHGYIEDLNPRWLTSMKVAL